ncbi:MAG: hypothetical protein KDD42_02165, partial [Bdellovibrionales bacterium]|nr:hypothetical protein [Bdellovibrionales bacterium]
IGLTDSWGNFLGNFSLQRVLFAVVAVFLLRDSIMTNFTYDGEARELLSQVHTTHEFDGIIRRIRTELEAAAEEDRPEVLVTGEAVWPTVWYMRGLPLRYDKDKDLKKYKYIFQDYTEDPTKIPEGFKARKVKLRGWWVPDYSNMTFGKFLNYAVNHVPWKPQHGGDPTGYSYITMLTRQDGAN